MPRRQGFRAEDYELAQDIDRAVGVTLGTSIPSRVCDVAEKWALAKLRKRAKKLWDAGHYEHSRSLYNFCALLEAGEV